MEKNNKKKIQKYTQLYMSLGMCFGVCFGVLFGVTIFAKNPPIGISTGMPIGVGLGMCISIVIGRNKDKQLSENMMEILRIEVNEVTSNSTVFVKDINNEEKRYEVSEKKMKQEKFKIGDRVAEEKEGLLVSLESK